MHSATFPPVGSARADLVASASGLLYLGWAREPVELVAGDARQDPQLESAGVADRARTAGQADSPL